MKCVGALDQSDIENSFLDFQNRFCIKYGFEEKLRIVLKCENGVQSFDDKQFEPFIAAVKQFIGCVDDINKLESLSEAGNRTNSGLMFDYPEFHSH